MPHQRRFAVVSSRIVLHDEVRPAAIVIVGEKIEAILRREDLPAALPTEDVGDLVVMPGLIDAHVHVNEPGRTDWEGFETATRAAAAGGVTTIVDMPLNSSPVTTSVAALEQKQAAARGKCAVDVGFYAGLVPGNLAEIEPLLDAGVCGVKAFLCDSGLPEFPAAGAADLQAVAPLLARRGVPLLAHAELVDPQWQHDPIRSFGDWSWARPASFELNAITLLEDVCRQHRCPVHVVHLSCAQPLELFAAAKQAGLPLTVETCPHYLHFTADDLAHANPLMKCAPPIRSGDTRKKLYDALLAGIIDLVGSDHSPCPPEMKRLSDGDWAAAWGGISSLQLTLPLVWSQRPKTTPFTRLAQWLSWNPARLVGLSRSKGRLAPGYDADLCVWNPDETWTARGADLQHRHKLTPYEGESLRGRVKRTYVRGQLVYDDSQFPGDAVGQLLRRESSP